MNCKNDSLKCHLHLVVYILGIIFTSNLSGGSIIPDNWSNESKEEKVQIYPFRTIMRFIPYGMSSYWTNNNDPDDDGLISRGYYSSNEYESSPTYSYSHAGIYPSSGGRFGGFSPLAIIAVSVFGVLAFILLLQLLGVSIARSLNVGPLAALPLEIWNMSEEIIPELMVKAAEWMELNSNLTETRGLRQKREINGVMDWVKAYKKDPYAYSCVRKLICETLANSTLAHRSVKSPLGGTIMSMMGRAINHGAEIVDLVNEVVGDPEKCLYFAGNELCD